MGQLQDQVAIITGAGTGIGRATAVGFARAGARVVLVGRRREPLEETAAAVLDTGGTALVQPTDITDQDAIDHLVERTTSEWGRIDVLINNAGLNVPAREMERISVEDWRMILETNLTGPFILTRSALSVMRRQQRGTVVNVSSMAGVRTSLLTGPAYSAAKAALNSFTESINLAERQHGIRACVVAPGEVDTPIMEDRPHPPSPEVRATMLQPEDVTEAILLVAALPQRAAIELVLIRPTVLRDVTEDRRRAAATG